MRINRRAVTTVAVMCLALGGVAACGSDDGGGTAAGPGQKVGGAAQSKSNGVEKLTADQIIDKAKTALQAAPSVRLVADSDSTKMNLAVNKDGDCAGTVSPDGTGSANIIKQGDDVYMKANDAFWKTVSPSEADTIETVIGDRYVKASASDPDFGFGAETCDLSDLSGELSHGTKGETDDKMTKGAVTTVEGVRVIELTGKDEDGSDEQIYVSTVGPAYPIKFAGTEDGKPVSLTFKDYGKPVTTAVPSADDVLDASKLKDLGSTSGANSA
jgi:hypothetical protein